MACARCHDHKFDPITVEDYYALAGVFASTRAADRAMAAGVDSLQIFEAHKTVEKAEAEIKKLDAEVKKLESTLQPLKDKPDAELSDEERKKRDEQSKAVDDKRAALAKAKEQIDQAKSTPGYELPLTPAALDATLQVKEAVGTHGSRIVYEPAPKDAAIEIRGNPNKTTNVVARRFVSVLSREKTENVHARKRRAELAETMFEDSSALIARVWVNRIWKQHFGVGLVDTPSDFGVQGAQPTHPSCWTIWLDALSKVAGPPNGFIAKLSCRAPINRCVEVMPANCRTMQIVGTSVPRCADWMSSSGAMQFSQSPTRPIG